MADPRPKPLNDTPLDAPPAYEGAAASSSTRPEKAPVPPSPGSPSSSSETRAQSAGSTSWAAFGGSLLAEVGLGSAQHRVSRQVRKTVRGLIRDLVRDQTPDQDRVAILDSCSDVCAAHSVHLPSLLQETYIEDHTPLYWAVVQRVVDESKHPASDELPPLIRALLAYSAPLNEWTIQDLQLACLHNGDQWLYQSLRLCPEFQALSPKSQLLLGVQVPPDTITVEPPARYDGPFTVRFEFPQFQKRLRVAQEVKIEFISHSRMWELSVFAVQSFVSSNSDRLKDGQWGVRLRLSDYNSPPTSVIATFDFRPRDGAVNVGLRLEGKLDGGRQSLDLLGSLPDVVKYARSPFLTADGALRGKLTIEITTK
ncbi:hypothetical protein DFH06DRAFT_1337913 [Mycena polygramma]|nr:hypothetical protein DFH06DRAFT_1337913 [Mycena polygramma]